jgi:hypothetical protein
MLLPPSWRRVEAATVSFWSIHADTCTFCSNTQLEKYMTLPKLIKTSNRPLALLSAAFLLQTGGALTAARAGDAQSQARELLSQSTAGSVAAQSDTVPGGSSLPDLDPQEQARRILLGTPSAGGEAEVAAPRYAKSTSAAGIVGRGDRRAHFDAQEMARRIILGTVI